MQEKEEEKKENIYPDAINLDQNFITLLLSELKLPQYIEVFEGVNIAKKKECQSLTEEKLNDLNIKPGHIRAILQKINEVNRRDTEFAFCQILKQLSINFALIGAPKAGKTSLLKQYLNQKIDEQSLKKESDSNLDVNANANATSNKKKETKIITYSMRGIGIECKFHDLPGQAEFLEEVKMAANKDENYVILAVCSVDNIYSISILLQQYLEKLQDKVINAGRVFNIFFICNKIDLHSMKENRKMLEDNFNRASKHNSYNFRSLYFVSAKKEDLNVKTAIDDIIDKSVSHFIEIKRNKMEKNLNLKIEDTFDKILLTEKAVAFWVEDDDWHAICYNNNNKCYKSNWTRISESGGFINYSKFEGNTWLTKNFQNQCDDIFKSESLDTCDDKTDAVNKLYSKLRGLKWHPLVFAINVNRKHNKRANCTQEWHKQTQTMEIYAFC